MSVSWNPRIAIGSVVILALATGCPQTGDNPKVSQQGNTSATNGPDAAASSTDAAASGTDAAASSTDAAASSTDAAASGTDATKDNGAPANAEIAKLIEQLASDDAATQTAAAQQLGAMGTAAAPAIDALVKQLSDDDPLVRAHTARALGQIGEAAKPAARALARAVSDDNEDVRRAAIAAIAAIKPGVDMAGELLIEALGDANPNIKALAVHNLAELGPDVVPAMIKAMEDDRTIYWAILVLYELGPEAKDAVPALSKALKHEQEEVRHEAAQALRAIGPAGKDAVPALIEALDSDITTRLPAALALGSIGPDAKDAIDKLQKMAGAEDDLEKVVAAWSLAKITPDREALKTETVPVLVERLKNEDEGTRRAAALALLDLDPGPEIMVPAVAAAMENASPEAVSDMLGAAASLGAKAVPNMIRALGYPEVRMHAVGVLGRIGPEAADAVPKLLELLDDADAKLRAEILFTLGRIGPAAKAGVPAAIAGLQDEDDEVRFSAVYALGKIGPEAAESIATLERAIGGNDPKYCTACAWALVRIDPENEENASKALPLMITALDRDQSFVRAEAAQTLGLLGARAKEALPKLKELAAEDKDPAVREAAAEAVELIEGGE